MSAFLVGLITVVAVVSYAITRVGLAGLSISIIMQLIHFHDEEKYAEWSKIFWVEFIINSICTLIMLICYGLMSLLAG